MITIIFVILAAICNAIMDTLAHHFSTSAFRKLNPNVWDPSVSWLNKYMLRQVALGRNGTPVFLTDAWHFFKALWLLFIFIAIVFSADILTMHRIETKIVVFIALRMLYGSAFSLFYVVILRKRS